MPEQENESPPKDRMISDKLLDKELLQIKSDSLSKESVSRGKDEK